MRRWRDRRWVETPDTAPAMWVGWGVFTTAGGEDGRPFLWGRHLARLAGSLAALEPDAAVALPPESAVAEALGETPGPVRIRLVVRRTGPARPWSVDLSADRLAAASCGPGAPPLELETVRWPAALPWAGHKTLSRLPWDHARETVRRRGGDDALLVDAADRVLETSVGNVVARFGDRLVTPPAPSRCLPGLMRAWLLERALPMGWRADSRDLELGELRDADDLWVTNAVVGVRRVGRLDDRRWTAWPGLGTVASQQVPAPGWSAGVRGAGRS